MNKTLNWVLLVSFFCGFAYVYLHSWQSLFSRWEQMDGSYSHGYLVLIISLYFIAQKVNNIDVKKISTNYLLFPLLVLFSLVWALSRYANIEVIHLSILPVILVTFFIFIFGLKVGKTFIFPTFFLLLALPIWEIISVPLQVFTVVVNTWMLALVGIPAFIDGFYVSIPAGNFEIAGGCSGLRYFIVALTLALLYSYQNYSRWRTWFVLIITAIVFALVTNWVRVFVIIVIGQVTEMQSSMIEDHDLLGWILFAVVLIPFFYIAYNLSDWLGDEMPKIESVRNDWPPLKVLPYIVAFLATFTLPLLLSVNEDEVVDIPIPAFTGERLLNHNKTLNPIFIGSDATTDETFKVGNGVLQVSVRSYSRQEQGKEMISYKNHVFSEKWKEVDQTTYSGFSFMKLINRNSGQTVLVGKQYSVSGYKTSNRNLAKLLEMLKPLMSSQISSILILATPCQNSCVSAKGIMNKFLLTNKIQVGSL